MLFKYIPGEDFAVPFDLEVQGFLQPEIFFCFFFGYCFISISSVLSFSNSYHRDLRSSFVYFKCSLTIFIFKIFFLNAHFSQPHLVFCTIYFARESWTFKQLFFITLRLFPVLSLSLQPTLVILRIWISIFSISYTILHVLNDRTSLIFLRCWIFQNFLTFVCSSLQRESAGVSPCPRSSGRSLTLFTTKILWVSYTWVRPSLGSNNNVDFFLIISFWSCQW